MHQFKNINEVIEYKSVSELKKSSPNGLASGTQLPNLCAKAITEAKKRFAMFVLEKYKPFSSFLFEAAKENADLEHFYNKIDYNALANLWIPAAKEYT